MPKLFQSSNDYLLQQQTTALLLGHWYFKHSEVRDHYFFAMIYFSTAINISTKMQDAVLIKNCHSEASNILKAYAKKYRVDSEKYKESFLDALRAENEQEFDKIFARIQARLRLEDTDCDEGLQTLSILYASAKYAIVNHSSSHDHTKVI